jgi:ATP-dependent helicase/DNAse subunit B
MSIDDYYLMGGRKNDKSILNENINHYIETKNQPDYLSKDMISLLYKDHLSVSQVETYNKCPYLYYIQYGLSISKSKEEKLLPNELGNLVHYVLSIAINEERDINQLVDYYLSKNDDFNKKIISSPINQYFISNLKKDLVVTLQVLKNMNERSLFEVTSKEEKIEDVIHDLNFKGFVDRIDTYNNYVAIIDYKSSAKDIDIDLAKKGFNIQMLLYLKMITKKYEKDPAAVLYFNTKKRVLSSKDSVNADIKENDFYSMYKYGGYVIDDDGSVIHAIDSNMDSKSDIVNVKYVKKSGEYKGHIMKSEELDGLLNDIEEHIYHLYTLMNEGHIEIFPKDSDNQSIHMKVNPCRYCSYKTICHFDVFYNEYDLIEEESGDEDAV